jgi:cell division protein FtsX
VPDPPPECRRDSADASVRHEIDQALRSRPGVDRVRFIDHAEAARLYRCAFRISDGGAPLPESLLVILRPGTDPRSVADAITGLPGVDEVRIDKRLVTSRPAV